MEQRERFRLIGGQCIRSNRQQIRKGLMLVRNKLFRNVFFSILIHLFFNIYFQHCILMNKYLPSRAEFTESRIGPISEKGKQEQT